MRLEGKRCWVIGLARSGCAAGGLLRRHGARVLGLDDSPTAVLRARWEREGLAGTATACFDEVLDDGRAPAGAWANPDLVVISPGVPGTHARLSALGALVPKTPVIGELELGVRFCRAQMAAITGTNGKSTTTELLAHLVRAAGRRGDALGNVGRPLCLVAEGMEPDDVAVLEVSSFQLETVQTFRPRVGAVLNLAPDHLDRYPDLASYYAAKRRLADLMPPEGLFVTWTRCPEAMAWPTTAARLWFGDEGDGAGVFFKGGALWAGGPGREPRPLLDEAELAQRSPTNRLNALAAVAMGLGLDLPREALAGGLRTFAGLADRHELVAVRGGVRFVNDTKATNVHAVCAGLADHHEQVVLIAGGSGKGEDYTPLRAVMGAVRHVVLIGAEGPAIGRALAGAVKLSTAADMDQAVALAAGLAEPDATVLLSPACASFDMFANYRERGAAFAAAALKAGARRP
jgi:UDP-N-acetylmuramoylalanine--D-glutamate ligase